MKKITKAFTLIELVVGITISMLLMVSVWIFVSNGMNNIFKWQKVLENMDDFVTFSDKLNNNFDLIQLWTFSPINTYSWIIFKRWKNFWEGGFSYIWTETLSWVYCLDDSQNSETNNIYIKNFVPFEEQWEDIFNNYNSILSSNWVTIWAKKYTSFQKEHKVIDENWNIIIWKWIFWDKFIDWVSWKDIYLNSPTWLTYSWNILFISDTLNNRVLYYDTVNDKIFKLLDETDWLNEPTWLYYDDYSLYITNSWNWEILKYSSKKTTGSPILTMSWFIISNVAKVDITFSGASTNVWLTAYNTWSIVFTNSSTSTDFLTWSTNNLKYYFVNYNSETSQWSCSWNEIDLIWDNPIQCISTWTWKTSTYQNKTLSGVVINNINNTSNTWTYFVDFKLLDSSNTILYQDYFPYFTQSDNDLLTSNDNILTVLYSWLNYPTWIWWTWNSDFNIFWDWTYSNIPYNWTDTLLKVPIKSLDITNISNDLITLILKYYKSYNCYNLDEKIERTFILKKNLK